jgi:hypothetical protein
MRHTLRCVENASLASYARFYRDGDRFIEGSKLRVAWMNPSANGLSLSPLIAWEEKLHMECRMTKIYGFHVYYREILLNMSRSKLRAWLPSIPSHILSSK